MGRRDYCGDGKGGVVVRDFHFADDGARPELRLHYEVAAAADRILSGQQGD